MKSNNVVVDKSYAFALKSIQLYQFLKNQKEFDLGRQILKSGTSIGANVEEAIGAHSERDFVAKLGIAYKESREAHYWVRLLYDASIITVDQAQPLLEQSEELLRIIGSIQKKMKQKTTRNS